MRNFLMELVHVEQRPMFYLTVIKREKDISGVISKC
jgi:hypothetical protein